MKNGDAKHTNQIVKQTVERFKKLLDSGHELPRIVNRRDLVKYLHHLAANGQSLNTPPIPHVLYKLNRQETQYIKKFLSESDQEVLKLVVKQYNFMEIVLATGLPADFVRFSLKRILEIKASKL